MRLRRRSSGSGGGEPGNFRIVFRRDVLAEALWAYGEDELAEMALQLGEEDLREVQLLAARRYVDDPEPEEGPKLTHGRIMARAMIEHAEGAPRDTKRRRRRTRPIEEGYNGAYHASLLRGDPLPSTPVETSSDRHG